MEVIQCFMIEKYLHAWSLQIFPQALLPAVWIEDVTHAKKLGSHKKLHKDPFLISQRLRTMK